MRIVAYTPSGVSSSVVATPSGKFEVTVPGAGKDRPVFIEVYSHDFKPLGVAMASGGATVGMKIDPSGFHGYRVEGGDEKFSETLDAWLDSVKTIDNGSISAFVASHRDSPAAYAVLTMLYDAGADRRKGARLLESIDVAARPEYYDNGFATLLPASAATALTIEPDTLLCNADTMFALDPTRYKATVMVFSATETAHSDSVVPMLDRLGKTASKRGLLVVEHNLSSDTLTWRRNLRQDMRDLQRVERDKEIEEGKVARKIVENMKPTWVSVWSGPGMNAPGASRYSIPRLPYFVVADSTGAIVYEGTSAFEAESHVNP